MASIIKSRARKALTAGKACFHWSDMPELAGHPYTGKRYNITIDEHKVALTRDEAIGFIRYVTSFETGGEWRDKRTTAERLRAFADQLEREK